MNKFIYKIKNISSLNNVEVTYYVFIFLLVLDQLSKILIIDILKNNFNLFDYFILHTKISNLLGYNHEFNLWSLFFNATIFIILFAVIEFFTRKNRTKFNSIGLGFLFAYFMSLSLDWEIRSISYVSFIFNFGNKTTEAINLTKIVGITALIILFINNITKDYTTIKNIFKMKKILLMLRFLFFIPIRYFLLFFLLDLINPFDFLPVFFA